MRLALWLERLAAAAGWEARAVIYQEIPSTSDPEEVLDLLDALRRRTRDGNDLFFLRATAHRLIYHPGLARAVEELQQRFFDHIPQPPEILFRRLEMPQGSTEAWREAPAGRFLMGSPDGEGQDDERPLHTVDIERSFRIGVAPVTNAQYAAFDPGHPVKAWEGVPEEELAHHPAGGVTWFEANAFCDWLSQACELTRGARLPGEEEWEHACRAGTPTPYWSGSEEAELDRVGWYRNNSRKRTHRVGEKPANTWGLFDLHGNVREWTASPYQNDYARRAAGTLPPARVAARGETALDLPLVLRGGGFWDEAPYTRSAIRCVRYPGVRFLNIGFRVLLDVPYTVAPTASAPSASLSRSSTSAARCVRATRM
jgi:formylglycine-generating enzyme required for sulfatase activity